MAEILWFHHVQGLTSGVKAFADELGSAGHTVHTPDVFDGRTFSTLEEGMSHAGALGSARFSTAESQRPGRWGRT